VTLDTFLQTFIKYYLPQSNTWSIKSNTVNWTTISYVRMVLYTYTIQSLGQELSSASH